MHNKIIKIGLCLSMLFLLTACNPFAPKRNAAEVYGCDTISVFNAGEYIDEETIYAFEDEFGARVIYETFDSNESAYLKMTNSSYDVVVLSDYMIERVLSEDMLQEIDQSKMTNIKNLAPQVAHTSFDPDNKYSIPYLWGTVGIVYNKKNVKFEDLERDGYGIFQNTDYKDHIYLYDSQRDSFMIALKDLGYSMNTENPDELKEAYEWLIQVKKTMSPEIVTDEVIDAMVNGQKDLAILYSGDAAFVLSENEDMDYYIPKQGTNLWVDSMVIPKAAKCPALANEFMNYMMDDDVAYDNSAYVGYTSSNERAIEDLFGPGGEYEDNHAYEPYTMQANDEVFHYNEKTKSIIAEYWLKVLATK